MRIRTIFFFWFCSRGFCPVSKFFIRLKLNFIAYLESTRRDEKIDGSHVTGGGRTRRHAPSLAAVAKLCVSYEITADDVMLTLSCYRHDDIIVLMSCQCHRAASSCRCHADVSVLMSC